MTYEEAIEIIKIAKADVEWNYLMDYQIAFEFAIECIAKQITKKPESLEYDSDCNINYWVCPHCGLEHSVVEDGGYETHCDLCGQAIDWNGVE